MSRSHRKPEHEPNGETTPGYYHVVCRDCRVESLETDGDEAREVATRHDEETGHDVTVGRL